MGLITTLAAPRWLTAEQQQIWRAYLLGSVMLLERIDADLRPFGLDRAEYEILVMLSETEGQRMRMSELADAVHHSRSRLTHTITRMEKADLVRRTDCPTDRRGVWAELTDQGFELIKEVAPAHVETVRKYFIETMSEEDYAAVGRALTAVVAACGER
jgi:DNA-binding MarR family transcriptional regulator